MREPDYRKRPVVLALLSAAAALVLIGRLFSLQVLHGAEYTESFEESVTREVPIPAKRGRILDRDGNVLAETKTSQCVTIVDTTGNSREENARLNRIIQDTLEIMDENGDGPDLSFDISWDGSSYQFDLDGQELLRFRADVYGYPLTDTLSEEEKNSSAEDIVLMLADRYRIEKDMTSSKKSVLLLNTVAARYNLALNAFQKYIPTELAKDVSAETVRALLARNDLDGVSVGNNYERVYSDSLYFSNVTGYISQISSSELSSTDGNYHAGDSIGKVGIEAYMEETLRGTAGLREISVDNLGREKSELSYTRPVDGDDVVLTIDSGLQRAAYRILEKNIRDIILSKMTDRIIDFEITEETDGSDIQIPAADVYASILCYVIDRDHFYSDDASESEQQMLGILDSYLDSVKTGISSELTSVRTPYNGLTKEYREYCTYIVRALYDRGVISRDLIDTDDDVYDEWTYDGTAPMGDFLYHAAEEGWIDTEALGTSSGSADGIFSALVDYILDEPCEDYSFGDIVCRYMAKSGAVPGDLVCMILFDQEIFDPSESVRSEVESGNSRAAYDYVRDLIKRNELTPGQLHLYPFSGSVVITDPYSGEVLALVSYPGYDCNLITDSGYMWQIVRDPSRPMLDHATQQRTAPGSTFKMVTAAAGISEGVVSASDSLQCDDVFDKIDPSPACWIYPRGHGWQNLQNAIYNSCNMYFYEVGYRLGEEDGSFDNETGIDILQKYCAMYGLDRKSGVEIEEADPSVATRDVVRAAIGQSNNGYTTAALARYVAAVATQGELYDLTLLVDTQDKEGNVIEKFGHKPQEAVEMPEEYWSSVSEGMRRVCANRSEFSSVRRTNEDGYSERVTSAGKTGTAQQAVDAPNHALFLGYAPFEDPEIAVAVRIPNGYSSGYAALTASQIMQYYFDPDTLSSILNIDDIPNYENGD